MEPEYYKQINLLLDIRSHYSYIYEDCNASKQKAEEICNLLDDAVLQLLQQRNKLATELLD